MRRTFALLLAAVMAAGTLTGPAMAAESQQEGTADSASQEVQEETKLPPGPGGDGDLGQSGQPDPVGEPERPGALREHQRDRGDRLRPDV